MLDDTAVEEGAVSTPADSPATTPPAAHAVQPPAEAPFHEHPRWKQLMQERNTDRQTIAQMRQQLGEFQRSQQQAGRPTPTDEQRAALEALRQLQALDPESGKHQQELAQLRQQVAELQGHYRTSFTRQGVAEISRMAGEVGLPTDPKSLRVIENAVTVYLADNPEAVQRFQAHDPSVLKDAFKEFNDTFLGKLRRESAVGLVEKKTAAAAIPTPARNGGPPGPAAPVRVTAANETEVRSGMREKLRALMSGTQE